jgi:hypothetical protein
MAQGKAFTDEQRDVIIQSLQPYLEMGLSRNRACSLIGLPPQTLSNWVQEDEALGIKLTGWENAMNVLATANIKSALEKESEMDDTKKETSKWWAERRMKEDFSTKTEVDQKIEGQLGVIQIPQKNANTLETPTEAGDSIS